MPATMAGFARQFGPFIDVRKYGATGDGVTDNTAAIQAAINAAGPSALGMAGTVFFPPGIYMVSVPLTVGPFNPSSTVPVSYPSIIGLNANGLIGDGDSVNGSSPGAVTLRATSSFPVNEYLLTVNAPNNNVAPAGAWVKGLSIDCNNQAAGVRLYQPRQFHCEDISIAHANPPGGYGAWDMEQYNASAPWRNYFNHINIQYSTADGINHAMDDFAVYYSPTVQNVTRYGFNLQGGSVLVDNPNYYQGAGAVNVCAIAANVGACSLLVRGFNFPGSGAGSTGGPNNAVQLQGTGGELHLPAMFEDCIFFNGPPSGNSEANAAMVLIQDSAYPVPALFRNCTFIGGPNMSDWAYAVAGTPAGDLITFEGCKFVGAPAVTPFHDLTGNDLFRVRNCEGFNPVGSVTVAVPASGTVQAAVPYDQYLYITASTSTVAVNVTNAAGTSQTIATIPASAPMVPVFIPAGSSWSLTYTTAPTALTAQGL